MKWMALFHIVEGEVLSPEYTFQYLCFTEDSKKSGGWKSYCHYWNGRGNWYLIEVDDEELKL